VADTVTIHTQIQKWESLGYITEGVDKLSFKPLKELHYISKTSKYQSFYYLINNNIILIRSNNKPNRDDVLYTLKKLDNYLHSTTQSFTLIWDIKSITYLNVKIRKVLERANQNLAPMLKKIFIVTDGLKLELMKIYKKVKPEYSEHIFTTSSIETAIKLAYTGQLPDETISPKRQETSYDDYSKEELIQLIKDKDQDTDNKLSNLLRAIGSISWNSKFKPVTVVCDEQDPFYQVYTAINILQNDIIEIIEDLKDLNKNLELKVAERIVDIIDKESNLRVILDNSDSRTWLINNRYELIDFNNDFVKGFENEHSVAPKVKDNILEIISNPEDSKKWKQRFDKALSGSQGKYLDYITTGGMERVYEVRTFPIKEVGKIKGVSTSLKDITDLKRSELKLIEKNKDLQKVNNELDSFVYRVSHDLRAPLTSILGLIELIKSEDDPNTIKTYIDLQEKSVRKLDNFIQDIINISRNARQDLSIDRINFEEILDQVFEENQYSNLSNKIENRLSLNIKDSFYSDMRRIKIIFNNLISNSIKYTNPYCSNPFVGIDIKVNANEAIIEIIDNGIGIEKQHIGKIFNMFYRADQNKSGSGLGLYIVRETVDKLKGNISVTSNVNVGTNFKIILPNFK